MGHGAGVRRPAHHAAAPAARGAARQVRCAGGGGPAGGSGVVCCCSSKLSAVGAVLCIASTVHLLQIPPELLCAACLSRRLSPKAAPKPRAPPATRPPAATKPGQVCANCGTSQTPLWRKDRETGGWVWAGTILLCCLEHVDMTNPRSVAPPACCCGHERSLQPPRPYNPPLLSLSAAALMCRAHDVQRLRHLLQDPRRAPPAGCVLPAAGVLFGWFAGGLCTGTAADLLKAL